MKFIMVQIRHSRIINCSYFNYEKIVDPNNLLIVDKYSLPSNGLQLIIAVFCMLDFITNQIH